MLAEDWPHLQENFGPSPALILPSFWIGKEKKKVGSQLVEGFFRSTSTVNHGRLERWKPGI
jgi:hypothetical protein